jgi:hypothetical protein
MSRIQAAGTIEIMSDEDNCMVRRVLAVDALERAFRGTQHFRGWIDDKQYRMGRCLQRDWLSANASPSSGRIERVHSIGEEFCLMPSGNGARLAPQERGGDSTDRLNQAFAAVGAPVAWGVAREFIDGHHVEALAKRWRMDKRTIKRTVEMVLDRVRDSEVYERYQWTIPIWAEAPEAAA